MGKTYESSEGHRSCDDQALWTPRETQAPALELGSLVELQAGGLGQVSRLLCETNTGEVTHLVVRRPRWLVFGWLPLGQRERIVPIDLIVGQSAGAVALDVTSAEMDELPEYRRDDALVGDVWHALERIGVLRRLSLPTVRVEARDGVVTLRGHVVNSLHRCLVEEAVTAVTGTRMVRNELFADDELEIAVAQALAKDSRTRPDLVRVKAFQGIVRLVGASDPAAAEELASAVSGVRVALALPSERWDAGAAVLLPRVGLPVYARDVALGTVEKVVMAPRRRRVTHLIVREDASAMSPSPSDRGVRPKHRVLPLAVVEHATGSGIHLKIGLAAASALPEYREAEYVRPVSDWTPPIDYLREDVCFDAFPGDAELVMCPGHGDQDARLLATA